jgi:nucleotide-binding universal stress UspA family protein
MITKVVVPLDGSALAERAVTPARSLAERIGATLLLMTARSGDDAGEARQRLDKQATALGFDRVDTAIVHDRSAAEAILTEARDPNAVVCMSTHGRSGLGQALLGSVAEAVLRGSDRPVLLVGPSLDRGC